MGSRCPGRPGWCWPRAVVCAVLTTVALIASLDRSQRHAARRYRRLLPYRRPTAHPLLDYAEVDPPGGTATPSRAATTASRRFRSGQGPGRKGGPAGQRQAPPAAPDFDAHPRYVKIGGPFGVADQNLKRWEELEKVAVAWVDEQATLDNVTPVVFFNAAKAYGGHGQHDGGVLRGCSDVPDAARIPRRAAGLAPEPAMKWRITLRGHRLDQRKHEWTDRLNCGQAESTWLP